MSSTQRKLKPYLANEFTNHRGHKIQVNDPVVVLTTCTSRAHIGLGRYLGYRECPTYYNPNKKETSVLVEVNSSKSRFVHKETGEDYNWRNEFKVFPHPEYPKNIGYYRDRPEYNEAMNAYRLALVIYDGKIMDAHKDYEWKDFPYKRISNLQLNKIYPVDVLLSALAQGEAL
jgi:hypothetical protein